MSAHRLAVALFVGVAAAWVAYGAPANGPVAPAELPRIVSLSPHITELLFAAGAGERLVGVDDSSDYPPAAARLPRIGEPATLDVEGLLRLKPTLIVLWESGTPPQRIAQLRRLHLPLYVTEEHRLDDIGASLIELGGLAGTLPAASAAAARYRLRLSTLRTEYRERPRLRVFYQVWDRPLYTLSGAQMVSEVLSLCGGDNIFAALEPLAPEVDRESVLIRNPEVILIAATGADGTRQLHAWEAFPTLAAVRHRHLYMVDPSLLGRMSPRILQGAAEVCAVLDAARRSP